MKKWIIAVTGVWLLAGGSAYAASFQCGTEILVALDRSHVTATNGQVVPVTETLPVSQYGELFVEGEIGRMQIRQAGRPVRLLRLELSGYSASGESLNYLAAPVETTPEEIWFYLPTKKLLFNSREFRCKEI